MLVAVVAAAATAPEATITERGGRPGGGRVEGPSGRRTAAAQLQRTSCRTRTDRVGQTRPQTAPALRWVAPRVATGVHAGVDRAKRSRMVGPDCDPEVRLETAAVPIRSWNGGNGRHDSGVGCVSAEAERSSAACAGSEADHPDWNSCAYSSSSMSAFWEGNGG